MGISKGDRKRSTEMNLCDFPNIIEMELTMRCNKTCSICQRSHVSPRQLRSDLDIALVKTVVAQALGKKVQINLGGLGESLLVRQLPDILAAIKSFDNSILTGFNTNGLLLTREKYPWLIDGRLDYFTISINAPNSEGYRWLVGDDTYELVCANAEDFLSFKGKGEHPYTTVHCFDLPRFRRYLATFVERWSLFADHVQVRPMTNWASTLLVDEYGIRPNSGGICERPWRSLAIDTGGGFHRCCASFLLCEATARIQDISISDYWKGREMGAIRAAMRMGCFDERNICTDCNAKSILLNTLIEHREEKRQTVLKEP